MLKTNVYDRTKVSIHRLLRTRRNWEDSHMTILKLVFHTSFTPLSSVAVNKVAKQRWRKTYGSKKHFHRIFTWTARSWRHDFALNVFKAYYYWSRAEAKSSIRYFKVGYCAFIKSMGIGR
jgi:hypothetical protein